MEQDALLGQIIDKYQILERIGSGGVAHVYKAVHIENQAVYALKVIRRSLLDNDYAVHRFRGEIDILQRLKHPHIIDLFASGKIDNRPYMLIEYLPLGTLRHFLVEQNGLYQMHEAIRIFRQLATALDYAHRAGVIHRDIKPENILLRDKNNAVLTDFGIARQLDSTQLTQMNQNAPGTARYMSPEQIQGEMITAQSDQYSFGIIVYWLITGHFPFRVDGNSEQASMVWMYKHVNEAPMYPSQLLPMLPAMMDTVLLKAISKQPYYRFSNITEFINALEYVVQSQRLDNMYCGQRSNQQTGIHYTPMSSVSGAQGVVYPITGMPGQAPGTYTSEFSAIPKQSLSPIWKKPAFVVFAAVLVFALVSGLLLFFNYQTQVKTESNATGTAVVLAQITASFEHRASATHEVPSPSPSPSASPSATATATNRSSNMLAATISRSTRTVNSSPSPTPSITATASPTATASYTITPSSTATASPSDSPTPILPTASPRPTQAVATSTRNVSPTPAVQANQVVSNLSQVGSPNSFDCVAFNETYRILVQEVDNNNPDYDFLVSLVDEETDSLNEIYHQYCESEPSNTSLQVDVILYRNMRQDLTEVSR